MRRRKKGKKLIFLTLGLLSNIWANNVTTIWALMGLKSGYINIRIQKSLVLACDFSIFLHLRGLFHEFSLEMSRLSHRIRIYSCFHRFRFLIKQINKQQIKEIEEKSYLLHFSEIYNRITNGDEIGEGYWNRSRYYIQLCRSMDERPCGDHP